MKNHHSAANGRSSNGTKLKDIAKETGFSPSLISMDLSGYRSPELIPEETRRKIDAAVGKLHYRPSALARGLRKGESRTIGVVISEITLPSVAYTVQHLLDESSKINYQLLLTMPHYNKSEEEISTRNLLERQVDGILYFLELTPEQPLCRDLIEAGTRVVLNNQPSAFFDSVSINLLSGMREAFAAFRSQRAARVDCIFGGDNNWARAYDTLAAEEHPAGKVYREYLDSPESYDHLADTLLRERPPCLLLTNRKFYRSLRARFIRSGESYQPTVIIGASIYTEILELPEVLAIVYHDRAEFLNRMLQMVIRPKNTSVSTESLPTRLLVREQFHTLPNFSSDYCGF